MKATIIKNEIISQYKSVRQFSIAMDISYSTLATALNKGDKGIDAMAYSTVVAICNKLSIDPVTFELESQRGVDSSERRLLAYYQRLNQSGQEKALNSLEELASIRKYVNKEDEIAKEISNII